MSEQTSEALRGWFKRVEPLYPELFNTAHAICGNDGQAEYALRSAILDVWSQNADGGMGFREKLRATVRTEAVQAALDAKGEAAEFTWPGFSAAGGALARQAAAERIETQRLLMLRFGVGLTPRRIAQLTGQSAGQVRAALEHFEARCRRALSAQDRSRFGQLFSQEARRQLGAQDSIPHPAALYRAFEAEAAGLQVSEHRLSRAVYRALVLLMALLCAALFWLFAVLVQPPAMETDGAEGAAEGVSVETRYQAE